MIPEARDFAALEGELLLEAVGLLEPRLLLLRASSTNCEAADLWNTRKK